MVGWLVRPSPESQLGRSVTWFPSVLSAEARGGPAARERLVAQLIAAYDFDLHAQQGGTSAEGPPLTVKSPNVEALHAALFLS